MHKQVHTIQTHVLTRIQSTTTHEPTHTKEIQPGGQRLLDGELMELKSINLVHG